MPERPADVWAGKRNFVRKFDLDDAGHDTRVVTTLGVADDEDWFARELPSPPTSIARLFVAVPLPRFVTNTSLRPLSDLLPAAATVESLDENDEGDDAPPSRRLRLNLLPAGYSNEEWTSR